MASTSGCSTAGRFGLNLRRLLHGEILTAAAKCQELPASERILMDEGRPMTPRLPSRESCEHRSALDVLILINPNAGRGPKEEFAGRLVDSLRARHLQPQLIDSLDELASRSARLAAEKRLRCVVAIGGDGTVRAVANSVLADSGSSSVEIPIAVVPMGTENLIAHQFQITADVAAATAAIEQRSVQTLDAGRVNGELFLIMFSCGFDADVIWRLHRARTGNISHFSYAKPIFSSLLRYRFPSLRLIAENAKTGAHQAFDSHWVFAFNLPNYARGLPIATQADANDGQLDICAFRGGSRMAGFFHFATVLTRWHGRWSGCYRERFTKLRIEASEPVPYQVDGDAGGFLPVEVEILPSHVSIVLPADQKASSG